jgi:hypothetical protein
MDAGHKPTNRPRGEVDHQSDNAREQNHDDPHGTIASTGAGILDDPDQAENQHNEPKQRTDADAAQGE